MPSPPGATSATVRALAAAASARLRATGIASARLDAELLLCEALGCPRESLYATPDRPVAPAAAAAFAASLARRLSGEPLAYILGRREFWSISLRVDARVLVPRPETETVVSEALDRLRGTAAPRVADAGTGSGAIALAIARERPDAEVWAVDRSPGAVAVATGNARRLGLPVRVAEGDLLDPVPGPLSAVVSNPPYLRPDEVTPEIAAEPREALVSGHTGLEVTEALIAQAAARLVPGGALVVEIAAARRYPVLALLDRTGTFAEIRVRPDLAGLPRVVSALRR